MKIVFITDFAAIQQESKSCTNLYSMVKNCILQILIYLKQCNPNPHNTNPINVGFKCCDSRSGAQYEIPRGIANARKKFCPFINATDILKQFSTEYKATHSARKKSTQTHNRCNTNTSSSTPIISGSRSRSSIINTPTSSMTYQLRNKSGLSQIIIALLECTKQFIWSDTLINNTTIDNDTIETQMIFILSYVPNNNSINNINEWKDTIKVLNNKSISINFIHIPSHFNQSIIPYGGNDQTDIKYINAMDICLKQLSYQSIGVIPLTLLWLAPMLNLQNTFIKIFKHNKNTLFPANKLYNECVKWSGNIVISNVCNSNSLRRSVRLNGDHNKLLINSDLVAIECNNKWKLQKENKDNKIVNDIYNILNGIKCLNIEGILNENCLNKMDYLPYVSFIVRANNNENTKSETQQFQTLFANANCAKPTKYLVVTFDNNTNMKGIMYSIIPSLVILRIYARITWNTKSNLINNKNNNNSTLQANMNLTNRIQSMFELNDKNRNNYKSVIKKSNDKKIKMKDKISQLKRNLQMLNVSKLNAAKEKEEKKKEKQDTLMNESSNESNLSSEIDTNHLEITINEHNNNNKTLQEKYKQICKLFINIYNMLLSKNSLKWQHLCAFIDITYKSFYNVCMQQLFINDNQMARRHIKCFLKKEIFIDPKQYKKIRNNLNTSQKTFDIEMQIILTLEYGCMHFKHEILVDPIARFKYLDAYLQKLQILYLRDNKSYNDFMDYIINKYAQTFPNTFVKYYENKEEDIPPIISSYLHQTNQSNNNNNNNNTTQYLQRHTNSNHSMSLSQSSSLSRTQTTESSISSHTLSSQSNHKIRNRKRKYSDMMMNNNNSNNNNNNTSNHNEIMSASMTDIKRFKQMTQLKKHVIITPASKSNTNTKKSVSNSSLRTLTRSQKGSGALRSMKRPLRLVLGDKTNSQTKHAKKKRKLNHSQTCTTNPNHRNNKQRNKPILSHSNTQGVFSVNSNNNNSNQCKIQRSSQWDEQNKVLSKRKKKYLNRKQHKKTPPLLNRSRTESNLFNVSDPIGNDTFLFQSLSKTQSMTDLSKFSSHMHSDNTDTMNESQSPLIPVLTRTCSAFEIGIAHRQNRLNMGDDNDEQMQLFESINQAMNPEWCNYTGELPPDNMAKVFVHPHISGHNSSYIAASQTNSIPQSPTPNKNQNVSQNQNNNQNHNHNNNISSTFIFGGGFAARDSGYIPETPELVDTTCNTGAGASNAKSDANMNVRDSFWNDENNMENMEDIVSKKGLKRQIRFDD